MAIFFILTFAFSWGLGGLTILAFGQPGYVIGRSTNNPLFFLFFGFGPSFAAFITAGLVGGRAEVSELLSRMGRWRVDFRWYATVVVGIPALALSAAVGAIMGGASASEFVRPFQGGFGDRWYQVAFYLLAALVGEILGGPLSEEPGWRGYALPRLLKSQNPLSASVALGLIWAVWHGPLFFMPGVHQFHMSFPLFAVNVVALSILFTWVFIHTRGSVFIAILMHLLFNLTLSANHLVAATVADSAAALLVVAMGGLR